MFCIKMQIIFYLHFLFGIHIIYYMSKNNLICTVTGKTVSVAPKVFDERALKWGSAENLRANYISSTGRKLLCLGKTVKEIREEYLVPDSVPYPSEVFVTKHTRWAKYRVLKNVNENKIVQ